MVDYSKWEKFDSSDNSDSDEAGSINFREFISSMPPELFRGMMCGEVNNDSDDEGNKPCPHVSDDSGSEPGCETVGCESMYLGDFRTDSGLPPWLGVPDSGLPGWQQIFPNQVPCALSAARWLLGRALDEPSTKVMVDVLQTKLTANGINFEEGLSLMREVSRPRLAELMNECFQEYGHDFPEKSLISPELLKGIRSFIVDLLILNDEEEGRDVLFSLVGGVPDYVQRPIYDPVKGWRNLWMAPRQDTTKGVKGKDNVMPPALLKLYTVADRLCAVDFLRHKLATAEAPHIFTTMIQATGVLWTKDVKHQASCVECGRKQSDSKRCSGCEEVHFCSEKCLTKAWPSHKKKCKKIRQKKMKVAISTMADRTAALEVRLDQLKKISAFDDRRWAQAVELGVHSGLKTLLDLEWWGGESSAIFQEEAPTEEYINELAERQKDVMCSILYHKKKHPTCYVASAHVLALFGLTPPPLSQIRALNEPNMQRCLDFLIKEEGVWAACCGSVAGLHRQFVSLKTGISEAFLGSGAEIPPERLKVMQESYSDGAISIVAFLRRVALRYDIAYQIGLPLCVVSLRNLLVPSGPMTLPERSIETIFLTQVLELMAVFDGWMDLRKILENNKELATDSWEIPSDISSVIGLGQCVPIELQWKYEREIRPHAFFDVMKSDLRQQSKSPGGPEIELMQTCMYAHLNKCIGNLQIFKRHLANISGEDKVLCECCGKIVDNSKCLKSEHMQQDVSTSTKGGIIATSPSNQAANPTVGDAQKKVKKTKKKNRRKNDSKHAENEAGGNVVMGEPSSVAGDGNLGSAETETEQEGNPAVTAKKAEKMNTNASSGPGPSNDGNGSNEEVKTAASGIKVGQDEDFLDGCWDEMEDAAV